MNERFGGGPAHHELTTGGPTMLTRRRFLHAGMAIGASAVLPWRSASARARLAVLGAPRLDPLSIPKYVTPLVIPPPMPPVATGAIGRYEIAVRQFEQQILPPGLPATTVWSYGSAAHVGTFNYPAFTIEARVSTPVRVRWINGLVDSAGNYLPHLLPVDPTLHWANPPGGAAGRDDAPMFLSTPGPYTGPVPMVTHLHGGRSAEESDR